MDGTPWTIDPVTRDVRVGRAVSSYRVTYADLAPSPPQLREAGAPDSPDITDDDLTLPDRSRDLVQRWSDEVTRGAEQRARQGHRHPGPPARHEPLHLLARPRRAAARQPGTPARADPELLRDPTRVLRAVRDGDDHDGAGAGHPGPHGHRLPARAALGRALHRPRQRRPRVARALLPGLRVAAVRADTGRPRGHPTAVCRARRRLRRRPAAAARSPSRAREAARPAGRARRRPRQPPRRCRSSRASSPPLGALFTLRNVVLVLAVLVGLLAAFAMPITAWLLRLATATAQP